MKTKKLILPSRIWAVVDPKGKIRKLIPCATRPNQSLVCWPYVFDTQHHRVGTVYPEDYKAAKKAGYRLVPLGLVEIKLLR